MTSKKRQATSQEIIDIIEKILIPDEMKSIDECEKELQKLAEEGMQSGMIYGYHYGIKVGHQNTIETLQKTVRALKGTY